MAESPKKVSFIDEYSYDELIKFLKNMIPVAEAADKANQAKNVLVHAALSEYQGALDFYYRKLNMAAFLTAASLGALGVLPHRLLWIPIIVFCVGIIMVPVAILAGRNSNAALQELPEVRSQERKLAAGLNKMHREYPELDLIPSEYRHADELNNIIDILGDERLSFGDAMELNEVRKHHQAIQQLQQDQAEQRQRSAYYKEKTYPLKTVNIIEAGKTLEEWQTRVEPLQKKNDRLRDIIRQHGDDPNEIAKGNFDEQD
ncbi:hypothetical protein [Bifidobacterium bombi]|uniref:Uncharacterized protein n=1 Tax=Bifidobacterium bombi DSM 19703 TaxID=1341695 RepID=A0A086BNV0_9BIFI|nr:hypothetical protein [Bifidobacterium bombi]KFF30614.1 hypothetical protein BBOMB_1477 [Bifidobacterium bombi DSM 19703]